MSRTITDPRRPPPTTYEIRVRGHLGGTMLRAFPGFHTQSRGGDTVLRGAVADQAALHGVLAKIEALGLELVELHRRPPEPTAGRPPTTGQRPPTDM
jgi:hypothetical protein